MEFIIVLLMFAVPIIVAALSGKKGNKTVVYKRLEDSVRKLASEQDFPKLGHDGVWTDSETEQLPEQSSEYITEAPAKTVEATPAVATVHHITKATEAVPQEEDSGFSFSDEEKKKMIIYSEILRPKFEE